MEDVRRLRNWGDDDTGSDLDVLRVTEEENESTNGASEGIMTENPPEFMKNINPNPQFQEADRNQQNKVRETHVREPSDTWDLDSRALFP